MPAGSQGFGEPFPGHGFNDGFLREVKKLCPLELGETTALQFLEKNRERPWWVACSGGRDSLFLAVWIRAHQGMGDGPRGLIHVDHQLRPESAKEQPMLHSLAQSLGWQFKAHQAPSWENRKPGEKELREVRYAAFAQLPEDAILLLGHHREDLLESHWISLIRGRQPSQLAFPAPVYRLPCLPTQVRPLLELSRREITGKLQILGLHWLEDSSNQDDRFLRNALRKRVLPAWRQLDNAPETGSGSLRLRRLAEEEQEALDFYTREAFPVDALKGRRTDRPQWMKLPRAIQRRLLHQWFARQETWSGSKELSAASAESILDLLQRGDCGSVDIATGCRLSLGAENLTWEFTQSESYPSFQCLWSARGSLFLPTGASLQAKKIRVTLEILEQWENNPSWHSQWLLWRPVRGQAVHIRTRQPGDRYQPFHRSQPKKLKELLQKAGIPSGTSRRLPCLCEWETGRILWVPGLPPAEKWPIDSLLGEEYTLISYADGKHA